MTTKCYIVDYDNKINAFKQLLKENQNQIELDNNLSIYNKVLQSSNNSQRLRQNNSRDENKKRIKLDNRINDNFSQSCKNDTIYQLNILEKYLDDILSMPGLTNEDLYNIKKDQEEIYKTLDNIHTSVDKINYKSKQCTEDKNLNKATPSITININNRENLSTKHKIDPHKIKLN
jgi:hypothetical protein